MKWLQRIGLLLTILLMIGLFYVVAILVPGTDKKMNPVVAHNPYKISDSTHEFHNTLVIADLHGDTLLWRRNMMHRHDRGHIDLPRLREGGVDIQIFSTVTKAPRGLNFDGNSADAPDNITLLAMAQFWPARTWTSLYQRAAFQAQRLQDIEKSKGSNLIIARTKADLTQPDGTIIGILATEGSHPLEGKIDNIQRLYDEGYRMMGLQHFFDIGRAAVLKMREMNIIVDVAHSSEKVVRDVLAMSSDPIIISHGGVRSSCANTKKRNLPDDILKQIAANGGILGVGYFNGAICDITPAGIADAIIDALTLMGPNAVALGSDFDGTVKTTLDTSELAAITQALRDRGVKDATIRKVMGENVLRFLKEHMPE